MFLLATTFALSFLGPLVNAQSTNDTALGIAAIEAHFTNADLVPSLLSSFTPTALMTVTFPGGGAISPGQNLTMARESSHHNHPSPMPRRLSEIFSYFFYFYFYLAEVSSAPEITIVSATTGSSALTGNFTLVMADADVVGTNESVGQTRHWLVNGVTLQSAWSCTALAKLINI
jgi:hypothetical protein